MSKTSEPITLADVQSIVGDIDSNKAAVIVATEASVVQLEEAVAWAEGESDVMGDLVRPISHQVSAIYDVLITELPEEERRETPPG